MSNISKFKITSLVRTVLLSTPEIVALIDNRVYPIVAPDGTAGDFIVYQRNEYSKDRAKMGVYSEKCRVFVIAVSADYEVSQELAYLIDEHLEGLHTDYDMDMKLLDSTEDYEDGKYIQALLFEID